MSRCRPFGSSAPSKRRNAPRESRTACPPASARSRGWDFTSTALLLRFAGSLLNHWRATNEYLTQGETDVQTDCIQETPPEGGHHDHVPTPPDSLARSV